MFILLLLADDSYPEVTSGLFFSFGVDVMAVLPFNGADEDSAADVLCWSGTNTSNSNPVAMLSVMLCCTWRNVCVSNGPLHCAVSYYIISHSFLPYRWVEISKVLCSISCFISSVRSITRRLAYMNKRNLELLLQFDRMGCCSDVLDLRLVGAVFESRPGHRLYIVFSCFYSIPVVKCRVFTTLTTPQSLFIYILYNCMSLNYFINQL